MRQPSSHTHDDFIGRAEDVAVECSRRVAAAAAVVAGAQEAVVRARRHLVRADAMIAPPAHAARAVLVRDAPEP